MLVDARHAPTANDVVMAKYFLQSGKPFVVVANKLDKLKKSEIEPNLQLIRDTLELEEQDCLVPFSAENGSSTASSGSSSVARMRARFGSISDFLSLSHLLATTTIGQPVE